MGESKNLKKESKLDEKVLQVAEVDLETNSKQSRGDDRRFKNYETNQSYWQPQREQNNNYHQRGSYRPQKNYYQSNRDQYTPSEKELYYQRQLHDMARGYKQRNFQRGGRGYNRNIDTEWVPVCRYCGRTGHMEKECRAKL